MFLRNKIIFYSVLLLFSIFTGISFAGNNIKIGLVDFREIITKSEAGNEASAKLKERAQSIKQELEIKNQELQDFQEKLKRESLVMSEEAKGKSDIEFRKKIYEFNQLKEKSNADLSRFENTLLDPMQKDIKDIVEDFSKKEGFTLIIDKRAAGVLYSLDSMDITDKIIQIYDKKFKQKK